jgi:hypothetical protein
MTTISDDDGDHINIAIPNYDKAAFDVLLRGIKTAGFNIGTFPGPSSQSYSGPRSRRPSRGICKPTYRWFQLSSERAKKLRLGIRTD